jgi:hypothetical protein
LAKHFHLNKTPPFNALNIRERMVEEKEKKSSFEQKLFDKLKRFYLTNVAYLLSERITIFFIDHQSINIKICFIKFKLILAYEQHQMNMIM